MSEEDIIKSMGDLGINKLPDPEKKKPNKSTTEGRARDILDKHKERLEKKEMCIITDMGNMNGKRTIGVMSFTKKEFSKLTLDENGKPSCDCRSKKFQTGVSKDEQNKGRCKHELAYIFAEEEKLKIPTYDEVMEIMGDDLEQED